MQISAQELYKILTGKESLIGAKGEINFTLNKLQVKVNDKNIIGNIIQDWLAEWFRHNSVDFSEAASTQEFPDFYLNVKDLTSDLLEIKAFDTSASANFDIANFESYCGSLVDNPYRINADYLIFGYTLVNGELCINNIWLKKIWEISGPSAAYPIKVQQKRKMIYNLRPITWYSTKDKSAKPFKNKEEFINALSKTLLQYEKTSSDSIKWLSQVLEKY